jgi:hypothetical protein
MVKTNLNGDGVWAKMFGGAGVEIAKSVISTSDGNYVICGYRQDSISVEDNIYVVKVDPAGNLIWEKTYGSEHSEMGEDIIETSDGNLLIAGSSGLYDLPGNNSGNNRDMYLLKTDQDGNILHEAYYWVMQGNQGAYDDGYAVCENSNGEYYIVGGCSRESVEVMDIAVVKTDSDLNLIWKENFEMNESYFYDFAKAAVAPAPEGGILICGSFKYASSLNNDLFVMKVDSSGNEEWSRCYGGDGSEAAYSMAQTQDGNFVFAGHTSSIGSGSYDVWLLKMDLETGFSGPWANSNPIVSVYPNPARGQVNICFNIKSETNVIVSIISSTGILIKELYDSMKQPGKYSIQWDVSDSSGNDVPAGIYYCIINSENFRISEKIVIQP